MFLFFSKYGDKNQDIGIKKLLEETAAFAVKKIEAETRWEENVQKDLVDRVKTIKVITGYLDGYLEADKIDAMYAHLMLSDEQKFVNMTMEIQLNHKRVLLEPPQSEIRKLIDSTVYYSHEFKYSPLTDNILCELNSSNECFLMPNF